MAAYLKLNRLNPEIFYMSLLHRNVLSQILAAIDPLIEVGAAVVNPLAGAGAKLVLTDVESIVNGTTQAPPSAPAVVAVPAPAAAPAPAPVVAPQLSGLAPAPAAAPAPLTAQDVIAALMQTLQALSARAS
jgi:pyruvate dehydrogenase E2 component (dihydrolipoamide acetyltransferase)